MAKTIRYVFILLGTVVLSLTLWWFVMGGTMHFNGVGLSITASPFQKGSWKASNMYYQDLWSSYTGNDGAYTDKITNETWDKVKSK